MPTSPTATTPPTVTAMVRIGTSPSHITVRMPTTQIMAVPRSDCKPKIMSKGSSTHANTSPTNVLNE